MPTLLLEPDFLVDETGAVSPGPLLIDAGRVVALGDEALASPLAERAQRVPLAGRFLAPGFANAHSHAFQRVFRGRVEQRAPGAGEDDFWSWRELMYQAALSLDEDELEAVATWAFLDMLSSGFVAVGEFHYVHHRPDGGRYDDGVAISRALARAAAKVGLRLVLLQTAYARAGHGRPALDEQRRFVFEDVDAFLAHARAARESLRDEHVTHGLAIHSVRACPRDWIEAVARVSVDEELPLHVHACEQPAEIVACREEHGMAPLALLESAGALHPGATVVHATHLEDDDPERLRRTKAFVCVCPSTERNLGDGLCPIADLARADVPLAVGSDSHARIDVVDELRSLEDHERLRLLRRNVLTPPGRSLRHALLPAGTVNGMRSLGLEAGTLAPSAPADLVAIETPLEAVASPEAAVDAWLVGGSGRDVRDVFVGGRHVLARGEPTLLARDDVEAAARAVLSRLGRLSARG